MDSVRGVRTGSRLVVVFALALSAVMASVATSDAQVAPERCFGRAVTVSYGDGDRPTMGNDVILGTDEGDVIYGRRGNDIICGGGGNDQIWGGKGNDRIRGGTGSDVLLGQTGDDQLFGGSGNDILDGGKGENALSGGRGGDQCDDAETQRRCEPPCITSPDVPELIDGATPVIRITNDKNVACHLGPTGLSLSKVVFRPGNGSVWRTMPRVDADGSGKIPNVQTIPSGKTLNMFLTNQARACSGNGQLTIGIRLQASSGAFAGEQSAQFDFATPSCGLGYISEFN